MSPTILSSAVAPKASDWPAQSARRADLIHKKNRCGLDPAELAEYERLQAIAAAIVQAALPPPMFTPDERAWIDAKAAG